MANATKFAQAINREHELATAAMDATINHAIRCGQLLIEQKRRCGHGKFQEWVKAHCTFSHDTANIYMRAARQKTSGVVFSSLRELAGLQRASKRRGGTACYVSSFAPDPAKHQVPDGHDLQAWAAFRAVGNYIAQVSKEVARYDAVAIMRGAIPQDMEKLRPHLRQLHKFICELREADAHIELGLPLDPESLTKGVIEKMWKPDAYSGGVPARCTDVREAAAQS